MRKFLAALTVFAVVLFFVLAMVFLFLVDTAPLSRGEYLKTYFRTLSFKYTGRPELTDREVEILYRWSCTGVCHGAEPIETVRHTEREWRTIIERMMVRNGADINEREAEVIRTYLAAKFGSNVPTILSPEANRFLKRYLWKSDFGESDLYVDVIYTPPEYFDLMGGAAEARHYEVDDRMVFMVYFNTHQEKLTPFPLDKLATLRLADGRELKPLDWQVTYESGDKHHREGVLRFEKRGLPPGPMELVFRDLPGQKERVFYWELPIPEFRGPRKEFTP